MNSQCDGDRDSYDAMVLLSGRYDFQEIVTSGQLELGEDLLLLGLVLVIKFTSIFEVCELVLLFRPRAFDLKLVC